MTLTLGCCFNPNKLNCASALPRMRKLSLSPPHVAPLLWEFIGSASVGSAAAGL